MHSNVCLCSGPQCRNCSHLAALPPPLKSPPVVPCDLPRLVQVTQSPTRACRIAKQVAQITPLTTSSPACCLRPTYGTRGTNTTGACELDNNTTWPQQPPGGTLVVE